MIEDERFPKAGTKPVQLGLRVPVADRFDPPLEPIPLEDVKAFCDRVMAELDSRDPKKRKKAA